MPGKKSSRGFRNSLAKAAFFGASMGTVEMIRAAEEGYWFASLNRGASAAVLYTLLALSTTYFIKENEGNIDWRVMGVLGLTHGMESTFSSYRSTIIQGVGAAVGSVISNKIGPFMIRSAAAHLFKLEAPTPSSPDPAPATTNPQRPTGPGQNQN